MEPISKIKGITTIWAAVIGKISNEVNDKQFETWSLELIDEKIKIVLKNEDKPLDSLVSTMQNANISPKEK